MDSGKFPALKPSVVLGVAAHPDDLEFGSAGSIAKWVANGAVAYYLILTNGNKGSEDHSLTNDQLRDIRRAEQRNAAKILGVKEVFFCDWDDGALAPSLEVKRDIVRIIRQVKPDTVITMDPTFRYSTARGFINHPDHRAAGSATLDAIYPLARDFRSFPQLSLKEGLAAHKVKTVLLNNFDKANYYEDISDQIETKLKALACHASQLSDPESTLEMVRHLAKQSGSKVGVDFAENFIRIDIN